MRILLILSQRKAKKKKITIRPNEQETLKGGHSSEMTLDGNFPLQNQRAEEMINWTRIATPTLSSKLYKTRVTAKS